MGTAYQGRWTELADSATGTGVSGNEASATSPAVAVAPDGSVFYAWVDGRNGNHEIYVAKYTDANGWQQLAGSAEQGGVSNSDSLSNSPSIAVDTSGNPVVAWTESDGLQSDIHVAAWDPAANSGTGAWLAVGGSTSQGGVSNTGSAVAPAIKPTSAGLTLGWLDESGGVRNVYVRRFHGAQWIELQGSATADGVSASATDVASFDITTDGSLLAVAWSTSSGTASDVYVREWTGTSWHERSGSATGGGVSASIGASLDPTVAYHMGDLYVAWADGSNPDTIMSEIYVCAP